MLELIAILSLLFAVFIGFWKDINVGLVALTFALILGHYVGGIPVDEIIGHWPLTLFFTTFGVTLLFAIAKLNGTLEKLSRKIIYLSKGRKALIPIIFYFLALVIAAIGPGNISTSALLLPIGLAIAGKTGISILMMSSLIILGSIAGGLSPLAPNGIVALQLAEANGVGELGFSVFVNNVITITLFCTLTYFVLGGRSYNGARIEIEKPEPFNRVQIYTLITILVLVVWVMVGGVELLTTFLASLMNEHTALPILGVLSGVMSIFSSAVGVVMPTLIPTTVSLAEELGNVFSPAILTVVIAVGSHITTVSPFSTMGALALATAPDHVDRKKLFRDLFIMAFIAGLFFALFSLTPGFGILL